jgi:hypothetical protein
MHRSRVRAAARRPDSARLYFAALVVALLFSQWMGLQHRILHAGWVNGKPAATAMAGQDRQVDAYGHAKSHSCALFDGITLAATAAVFVPALPVVSCAKVTALWIAYKSWAAPLTRFFSSRAPPAQY